MHLLTNSDLCQVSGSNVAFVGTVTLTDGDNLWIDESVFFGQHNFIIDGIAFPEVFTTGLSIDNKQISASAIENGVVYTFIDPTY